MPVVKDRRSSPRVGIDGLARVLTDRDRFEGRCLDLGLLGLAIRSTRAVRPQQRVTLELLVHDQRLRAAATVARRQREAGEYVLGLALVDLDLDVQRRIEHLVFTRLAGSPLAEFMRAFVAHAERVPPPPVRPSAAEGTVVAGVLPVPVITGHTQIVAVGMLPMVDRTVIAPPPPRSETVLADAPQGPASAPDRTVLIDVPREPGAPDDAWLDDEMDTEQFRLLEAAQAREAGEHGREEPPEVVEVLAPDDPVPDDTVIVGGFTLSAIDERAPRERTLVTAADATERPLHERTLVTADATERPLHERTLVTADATERPLHERTLVTADATERPLHERTLVTAADAGERTIPFLRELLGGLAPRREAAERTSVGVGPTPADALPSTPTARALLEAAALLRPSAAASGRRGPRVVVSIPHRTYRRSAPTPWNLR